MSCYGGIITLTKKQEGFCMNEINYIRQTETENAMGDRIYLCYFITQSDENEAKNGKRYGVGIDMYTQLPSQRTNKERKSVDGIFRTKLEAELFIQLLCKGYVTPITLEDVVDDNLAEFAG